ncbi:methyltransferase DPH5 related protein (diphthamide biosynthesis) [Thermoplasma acidophilum]|uniref:Diphthine synthase n=1 Tax=Thermoplasma acidophilum (strain ATCC 25905 / DSM 1728 / JCM 9062 / NBRC 15155 / AMRC-C165) TaxID=273075 RepID=DPHB_THEAC|nr:diphthine synthase [Thermoplasma acidophilum]Q9HJT0.1 RecName: Full=Diphthine synthase; AltName: Full=Diphthamide biosynthesis methyltransferase [Thermoplasma acidophilum DSM 1728]MCY0851179.1 diphthine synthase [Thermoplasma acidophilum]CAC12012.1 methyltransferase DPH5 related protein (diphthamide biosynthesis) [Thermoplasma acidophilum]
MLNIIGVGLRGTGSITFDEFDALRTSDFVYADMYTSIGQPGLIRKISAMIDRDILPLTRDEIENGSILPQAASKNVSLIVVGDPLMATTHNELRYEAMNQGIGVRIFENASILNAAIGKAGLMVYKVAPPVSLPRISEKFFPLSVIDKIKRNADLGLHTPVLIDLEDQENIPLHDALASLLEMERRREYSGIIREICVLSRISFPDEKILFGRIEDMMQQEVNSPYMMFILSKLDDNERRFLSLFSESVSKVSDARS